MDKQVKLKGTCVENMMLIGARNRGVGEDGTAWEKVKSWLGFKLHLIVDANYELPVAMKLTKASVPDVTEMPAMFAELGQKHPEIIQTCDTGIGDKGYDDSKLISDLGQI